MKINRTELADILGVSMPTITSWMGEEPPLPYIEGGGKGKPFVFDSVACIEWWAANKRRHNRSSPQNDPFAGPGDMPETFEDAERRKMIAQADKAELELAKAAGLVVEIKDVEAVVAEMHVKIRTRLLAIGNKVRVAVNAYLGGNKEAVEQVVKTAEEVISEAMAEIRDKPFEDEETSDTE